MKHVSEQDAKSAESREVFSVKDFCRRNGLDRRETRKLQALLGAFATKHELQMNAQRRPAWR